MKKTVFTVLYLMIATTVVFYWPKIVSSLGNDGGASSSTLAEDARMAEDAYFALREVASVQLGYVQISYEVDEENGSYRKRFTNTACPTLQDDPEKLMADHKKQQGILHHQILWLGPLADKDESDFITRDEGFGFRDLFEFGHLAAHVSGGQKMEITVLAKAAGLDSVETLNTYRAYKALRSKSPSEKEIFFP